MARTKRTFEKFKKAVANESKHYNILKPLKGEFNEKMLIAFFDSGMSAREACNAMIDIA